MTTLTRHLKAPADQPPRKPLYLMGTAAARMDAGADHLILHKGAGSLMRNARRRGWLLAGLLAGSALTAHGAEPDADARGAAAAASASSAWR